jgi:signal transduction histidine kinase
MKGTFARTTPRRALESALIYALLGVAWIMISDAIVERSALPPGVQHFVQSWKGSLFVLVTAAMLYLLLRVTFSTISASQVRIETLLNQLRLLARHERGSREQERARIARDLHDELGQQLTGLKFDVAAIAADAGAERPAITQRLTTLSQALDEAIRTVRRISTELRPGVLDQLGLPAALEWVAHDYSRRTGIRASITVSEGNLPDEIATALFRVVQESLTNIARHSGATEFSVVLSREPAGVVLEIRDNGVGYSQASEGFGVLGMRERVETLGGSFTIGPVSGGQGTQIRCSFPV